MRFGIHKYGLCKAVNALRQLDATRYLPHPIDPSHQPVQRCTALVGTRDDESRWGGRLDDLTYRTRRPSSLLCGNGTATASRSSAADGTV
jgi:hypothetical protein